MSHEAKTFATAFERIVTAVGRKCKKEAGSRSDVLCQSPSETFIKLECHSSDGHNSSIWSLGFKKRKHYSGRFQSVY